MSLITRLMVVLCLLLVQNTTKALAQTDTLFWFAAPEVSVSNANFDKPIRLFITTYGQPATVTVTQPAGGGMPLQSTTIPANSSFPMNLTTWISSIENLPANTVLNYGLRIHSTAPVTIYYEVVSLQCWCNPEIYVLKGKNALGTNFYIPSQNFAYNNSAYSPTPYSSFDIVATDNNTVVTITPSNAVVGHPAGVPFNVTLNVGQTYSARATSGAAAQHLQGSLVTSSKPVAITVSDDLLTGVYGGCADLSGDQIVPVPIVGTEYIAVNGALNAPYDKVFITATQNNTTISQDGTLVTTINAGQTHMLSMSALSTYIQTSNPAYSYQLSGIGCELGTAILPKLVCTGSKSVSFARSSPDNLYVTLIVKNGGQGNFSVNGVGGVITAPQFSAVPGTASQWYAARITLPQLQYPQNSVISVTNSTHTFHLGVLDGSASGGARFGFFSDFGSGSANIYTKTDICTGDSLKLTTDSVAGATYVWTGPGGFNSNQRSPVILNATTAHSGIYTLTVTGGGCSATSNVTITVYQKPVITVNPKMPVICEGDSVVLTATGASSFTWSPATGLSGTTTGKVTATPTSTTTYLVTGINGGVCSDTESVTVTVSTSPVVKVTPEADSICGQGIVVLTASGAQTYSWSPSGGLNTTAGPVVSATVNTTTTYTVTGSMGSGCSDTATATIYVGANSETVLNIGTCSDTSFVYDGQTITDTGSYKFSHSSVLGCDSITILNYSRKKGPLAAYSYTPVIPETNKPSVFTNLSVDAIRYHWDFGDDKSSTEVNPTHQYARTGTYKVCLTAYSEDECRDVVCKDVMADVYATVDVPNAFSPNGDGINDKLLIRGSAVADVRLRIYNRWGQMIFETTSMDDGWDGSYKGEIQDMDVMAYSLTGSFIDGNTFHKTGNITIIH